MPFYKYLPPERIDVLQNRTIRFTQPSALNDPFESAPSALRGAMNFYERDVEPRLRGETPGRRFFWEAEETEERGMLSLTDDPANELMWAHYAASHTGFLIEFRSDHCWFNDPSDERKRIRKVEYFGDEDFAPLLRGDLFSKSKKWDYEREWRMAWSLKESYRELEGAVHLFPIPRSCISGVILGVRASMLLQDEVFKVMRRFPAAQRSVMRASIESGRITATVVDDPTGNLVSERWLARVGGRAKPAI